MIFLYDFFIYRVLLMLVKMVDMLDMPLQVVVLLVYMLDIALQVMVLLVAVLLLDNW